MGWRFDKKGDKYRIWSTITDSYLTDWYSRKEILAYMYRYRIQDFKKDIIELYMSFPDKRRTMEGNKIHIEQERRETHSAWVQHLLYDLEGKEYEIEIERMFNEALEFMGMNKITNFSP